MSPEAIIGLSVYLTFSAGLAILIWHAFKDENPGPGTEPLAFLMIFFFPSLLFVLGYYCLKHTSLWLAKMIKINAEMRERKRAKTIKQEQESTTA